MDRKALLIALKSGDATLPKELLDSVESSAWPVEILIPFVLRKVLQDLKEDSGISYVEKCFRMFSGSRILHELQKREAAELHRMSLLAESLDAMLKFTKGVSVDKLGDFVMRKFQLVVRRYGGRRYGRQFKYLVTVCHRRSRLLDFQKKSRSLYSRVLGTLSRRGLSFIESLISVMIA